MEDKHGRAEIEIRVSFPITKYGPFKEKVEPGTTVGTALADAMTHFEVHDDSQFMYVLAYDGQEQNESTTVGSLAGKSQEVRFSLVKKITQG